VSEHKCLDCAYDEVPNVIRTEPPVLQPATAKPPTERERLPMWDYMFGYFPLSFREEVRVAWEGNKQHNPGTKMHWAREKSTDHLNKAFRHIFDHGTGQIMDTDGTYHLAKAIWRLRAELQLLIEKRERNTA